MKKVSRKRVVALAVAALALALLLAVLCIACRQGQSGDDPAVTDTDPSAESVTLGPEQETPEVSADEDTSDTMQDESVDISDTSDTAITPETQAPSLQETTDTSETDGATEPDTSHEEPAFPPSPTYEEYCAMTSQEQVEFFNSFEQIEDYFLWFEAAKKDYEDRHPGIEIGPDGVVIP